MTSPELVFMHTDALPVTFLRKSGRERRRWQGRLWPEDPFTWVWTCDHEHRWRSGARRCAGRMMRLLELYADADCPEEEGTWLDQIKAMAGYRDERTPPPQTG